MSLKAVYHSARKFVGKGQPTASDVHVRAPMGNRRRTKKSDVENIDTDPPLNNLEAEFIHAAMGRAQMDAPSPWETDDDDNVEKKRHPFAEDDDEPEDDEDDYDDIEKASPRRVASVAVMHGDHMLMGKRRDNGKWTLPGGHVDDGEDFHSGALRELLEETGIDTDQLSPITDVNEKTDREGLPLHVQGFGLDVSDDDRPPTTMQGDPDGEIERWQWINMADGIPSHVKENMHVPPEHNVVMQALGYAELVEKDGVDDGYNPDDSWLHNWQDLVSGMDYEAESAGDNDHDTHKQTAAANLAEDPDHYKNLRAEDGEDVGDGLNLDLGSGQARQSGYLGVDTYKYDHGTVVHDLTCGLPFADGSASNVRMVNAMHTVDHPGGDIKPLLSEIQRVLMPGGQFYYEGPSDISNDASYFEGLADVTPEEVGKDAAGDNSDTGFPEGDNDTRWHYHVFSRLANPDAAASDDAEPRIGLAAQDLGSDTLLASDAASYYSEDSTTTGAGNKRHGYPSQGALVTKGGPGSGRKPESGGEVPYHLKHVMNGSEVHSHNHTNESAMAQAKELRAKGVFGSVFHVSGPKTGPKSNYLVSVPKGTTRKSAYVAKGGPGSGPRPGSGKKYDHVTAQHAAVAEARRTGALRYKEPTQQEKDDHFEHQIKNQPEHEKQISREMREFNSRDFGNKTRAEINELANEMLARHAAIRAQHSVKKSKVHSFEATDLSLANPRYCPIFKAVASQQIVYCVVLTPDEADEQDDFMDAEDIEETAHNYLLKSRVIGSNHTKAIQAAPVESYIAPCDFDGNGQYGPQTVKKGSWCIGIKVFDSGEWKKVEKGEYQGVSVGGLGLRDRMN